MAVIINGSARDFLALQIALTRDIQHLEKLQRGFLDNNMPINNLIDLHREGLLSIQRQVREQTSD